MHEHTQATVDFYAVFKTDLITRWPSSKDENVMYPH